MMAARRGGTSQCFPDIVTKRRKRALFDTCQQHDIGCTEGHLSKGDFFLRSRVTMSGSGKGVAVTDYHNIR